MHAKDRHHHERLERGVRAVRRDSEPNSTNASQAGTRRAPKASVGRFEFLVLAAVDKLRAKAYGAEITRYLSELLGRDVTVAQVYLTLARLEEGQIVRSEFTQPTRERGGRAKRLFTLEAHGVRVLRETAATLRTMTASSTEESDNARKEAPSPA